MAVSYIIVPPGIEAVRRQSPPTPKKRTPWHPQPDGSSSTMRSGGREWFSDRVFVEPHDGHQRSGYGTSVSCHSVAAAVVIAIIVTRPVAILPVGDGSSPMVMPASLAIPAAAASGPRSTVVERSAPKKTRDLIAPPPPAMVSAPTPLEAPSEIEPETGAENGADGVAGGVPGGVPGGVVGATALDGEPGGQPAGPLRVGGGVKPPRKIKDVKPVFPPGVLADQMRGTVIIEATIDTDGKVQSAKVVHSVPALDRAALDAVRQWEYSPSTLDGRPVAIVFTVVVNFTIQ